MTQTIEYVVKVNATQAQAAVADVEKRFGGVDTVVARLDKNIIALERDMKDLNAAIAAGGPNVERYKKELENLQAAAGGIDNVVARADKAVIAFERDIKDLQAAIAAGGPNVAVYKRQLEDLRNALYGSPGSSGRGGAGGGMGVGMAALEASRAIEDLQYGIGGVVNNIPGIVMALGGGAGLTAAISLGAVAVNQLAKNFGLIDPAAKKAAAAAADYMKNLRGEIAGLQRDLRSLQVGAERAAMEAQSEAVGRAAQAAEAALAPLGGLERFSRLEGISGLPLTIREQMDAARTAMEKLDAETAKLAEMRRIQLEKDAQREIEIAVDVANAKEEAYQRQREKEQKQAEADAKLRYDIFVAGLEDEDKALAAVRKSRAEDRKREAKEMAKEFRDMDRERAKIERERERDEKKALRVRERERAKIERERERDEKKALRVRESEHERTMRAMQSAEKRTTEYQVQLAEIAVGQMTSALTDYITAKIEGEEHAEKKAIASFLSATGNQLIASGVRGVFEGALISANPLTPGMGAGMMLTGGAAIAAGAAMSGGGSAVMASIPKSGDTSGATRDPGASPRRMGGGGDSGGPLVVNVSYGAGGPLPEDIAREINRVVSSGNRRRGAA